MSTADDVKQRAEVVKQAVLNIARWNSEGFNVAVADDLKAKNGQLGIDIAYHASILGMDNPTAFKDVKSNIETIVSGSLSTKQVESLLHTLVQESPTSADEKANNSKNQHFEAAVKTLSDAILKGAEVVYELPGGPQQTPGTRVTPSGQSLKPQY